MSQKEKSQKEEVEEKKQAKPTASQTKSKSDKKTEKKVEAEEKSEKPKAKRSSSKEKIDAAEAQAKEWNEKYLRLSAEFDNYRKRTLKEKADLTKTANADLLQNILPVVDDFERGLNNINEAQDIKAVKEGIALIYNKFSEFLKQNGVKEIEATEKEFDLDFHEALTKIPAPDDKLKGKVVDVIEKGYMLNDKVIRYAKVVVGE